MIAFLGMSLTPNPTPVATVDTSTHCCLELGRAHVTTSRQCWQCERQHKVQGVRSWHVGCKTRVEFETALWHWGDIVEKWGLFPVQLYRSAAVWACAPGLAHAPTAWNTLELCSYALQVL